MENVELEERLIEALGPMLGYLTDTAKIPDTIDSEGEPMIDMNSQIATMLVDEPKVCLDTLLNTLVLFLELQGVEPVEEDDSV